MAAAAKLADHGIAVDEAHPDLKDVRACNHTLRAMSFAGMKPLLDAHRDQLKPEVIWNIEKGLKLTGAEIARAEAQRVRMFHDMAAFFDSYDLLLCPTTIVPPYPVEQRYVTECDGVTFDNYVDWLTIVSAITLSCSPAISIPCGADRYGLPFGLQIIAARGQDRTLLEAAQEIEAILRT